MPPAEHSETDLVALPRTGPDSLHADPPQGVDGDGLVVIDPTIVTSHTSEDVLALVLAKKLVKVVLKSPVSGLTKTYSGEGYITSFSLSTPAGDNSTYNFSLSGSGDLTPATNSEQE